MLNFRPWAFRLEIKQSPRFKMKKGLDPSLTQSSPMGLRFVSTLTVMMTPSKCCWQLSSALCLLSPDLAH